MNKQALRQLYLQKRMALTEAACAHLSHQIYNHLFAAIDFSFVKMLHTFLPMKGRNEPDTWLIIDRIRREFPHMGISIPRVNAASNEMENFTFEGLHQIIENKWGIPEPKQGIPTENKKIDMILVPMLVGDLHGDRVGYGKGFYDRFISATRGDCKKIGLSFFEPVEKIDGVEVHDQKLNFLITPSGVVKFS